MVKQGAVGANVAGRADEKAHRPARHLADGSGGDRRSDARRTCVPLLATGDIVIDGGNSYYIDDIRRAERTDSQGGIHYVDVGTSGGVWGLERGYCQMIGGEAGRSSSTSIRSSPRWRPPIDAAPAHARAAKEIAGTAEHGYLHCGPNGAGHFVKMVHNGIEYGIMAAYAEGLAILRHANVGKQAARASTPRRPRSRNPEHYQYDLQRWPTSPKSGGAAASSPPGCWT